MKRRPGISLRGLSLSVLIAVTSLGACRQGDRRSEEEGCVFMKAFPGGMCGTPEEARRLDPQPFICFPDESSCRVENVRGPFPRKNDFGVDVCCYNFTLVYIDDGNIFD